MAETIEPSANILPTNDNATAHDLLEKTIEPSANDDATARDLTAETIEPAVGVLSTNDAPVCAVMAETIEPASVVSSTVSDSISYTSSDYTSSPEVQVSSNSWSSTPDSQFISDSWSFSSDSRSFSSGVSSFPEVQFNKVIKENSVKINKQKAVLLLAAIAFFIAAVVHLIIIIAFWEISKSRADVSMLDLHASNLASLLPAIQTLTDSGIKRNMTRDLNNQLIADVGMIELDFLELKNSTTVKFATIDNVTNYQFEKIYNSFTQTTSTFESSDKTHIGSISSEDVFNILLMDGYSFSSCANVFKHSSSARSGYYKVRLSNGSIINAYCARSCGDSNGTWMKVADLDMTDFLQECPVGLSLNLSYNRLCTSQLYYEATCASAKFPVYGIKYSKVCGRIHAFQVGSPDAFGTDITNIESNYVDGVSLTHGTSPRQHIWTFAAADKEGSTLLQYKCPCINTNFPSEDFAPIPPFVGEDYFCATSGSGGGFENYYVNPLWSGRNCGPSNTCCSFNNPPWFNRQLPQSTTDDIEVRVCRNEFASNEDIGIQMIEIFVE